MQWSHSRKQARCNGRVRTIQTASSRAKAVDLAQLQEMAVSNLVALSWEFAKQRATEQCTTVSKVAFTRELYPKAVSQLSWSMASSRAQDKKLMTELATAVGSNARSFAARDLAVATWALATLFVDANFAWGQLQFYATRSLMECSPQDVSNVVWAFAKCLKADHGFFVEAVNRISQGSDLAQFSSQGITNLSWAFAISSSSAGLEETVQEIQKRGLSEFTPKAISILAWCCATSLQSSIPPTARRMLSMIERTALNRMSEFSAQGLSNLSWAFASTSTTTAPFACVLGKQVLKIVDMPLQEASNTCWAFSASQYADAVLFAALSRRLQDLLRLAEPKASQRAEIEEPQHKI